MKKLLKYSIVLFIIASGCNYFKKDKPTPVATPTATATISPTAFVPPLLSNFLWKPLAEHQPKLVVLFSAPGAEDCQVVFNGQKPYQENWGPSNGRDFTIRFDKAGCDYGRVLLEAFCKFPGSSEHVKMQTVLGGSVVTINNGCERVEF